MVYSYKEMLKFKNRFHGHNSLSYVYRHGKTWRSKLITLKFLHNNYRQYSRVAVVVSKKVEKTAVGRNRIRRRIYEIIYHQLLNFKMVLDLVIIVQQNELNKLNYLELKTKIETALRENQLI